MTLIPVNIRLRLIQPDAESGFEWTLTADDATINEGDLAEYTLTLDRNDEAMVPCSIEFWGQTTPSLTGTYQHSFFTSLSLAAAATTGATVDSVSPRLIHFDETWAGTFQFNLPTVNKPEEQGDVTVGIQLRNASHGTILTTDYVEIVIADTFVEEPAATNLSYITIDSDWVDVDATAGTRVGEILGWDSEDASVALSSVSLLDDNDGRFEIVQETTHFYLDTTGSPSVSFESAVAPVPEMFYPVTVRGTDAGALTADLVIPVRPRYTVPNPTGGLGGTETEVTTIGELRTEVNKTENNRIITIPESITGVLLPPNTSQIIARSSNMTYQGHSGVALRHGRAWLFRQGNNIIVRNFVFGASNDFVGQGTPALDEVDNVMSGFQGTDWLENLIFENCDFFASSDELAAINCTGGSFAARGVRYHRCVFADPFYDAGHPKGAQHNHGPGCWFNCTNIIWDKNIMWACDTRMPMFKNAYAVSVINNIIGFHKNNVGATRVVGTSSTLANALPLSCRVQGNLRVPPADDSVPGRERAIYVYRCDETITSIYIPTSGDCDHFVDPAGNDFTDDPVSVGDGIYLDGNSSSSVLKSTPGYELTGITIDPTTTEQNRIDLWDDIVGDCGSGSLWSQDIIAEVEAGTARENVTPTQFASRYGTAWDGVGGSLGHGVV